MNEPLSTLANLMPSTEKRILFKEFANIDKKKLDLLQKKGVFPYDYMDSPAKLIEPLPDHKYFYNLLTDSNISDEEYRFAKNVFNEFECLSMRDYAQIYLKLDVIILADVFEYFRSTMRNIYALDAAQYITLASFSFDAMLKYTKAEIELLTRDDMIE